MLIVLAVAFLMGLLTSAAAAQPEASGRPGEERPTVRPRTGEEAAPGEIIVKYKTDAGPAAQSNVRREEGLEKKSELGLISAEVVEVEGRSTGAATRDLNARADVEYAEPDFEVYAAGFEDESRFGELWGLNNTGQTIDGQQGVVDVDVNGNEASARTQGSSPVTVAMIDSGVDFSHLDLSGQQWKNPGESGGGKETDGIDNDGNGYVDDVTGWDFYNGDNTTYDPDGHRHGTHAAGIIAASVNGQGIVGVAPNVKLMDLKFLGPDGTGKTSGAIKAIQYAKNKGVKISNNSWGGGSKSRALKEAIDASGSLFVASAGNRAVNNDVTPYYPSSYPSPNILSVAPADNRGRLATFSNYGRTSVDISAPGVAILSSVPVIPGSPAGWEYWSGGSMATPHATGAAALVASKYPDLLGRPTAIKKIIMDTGKPLSATMGKTVTGDMVDAQAALFPRVTATYPIAKKPIKTGVAQGSNVTATFSEAMAATSVNATTFTLIENGTTRRISATVTYDATAKKATLNPSARLAAHTVYKVTVKGGSTGVKNSTSLADPIFVSQVWRFKTGGRLRSR